MAGTYLKLRQDLLRRTQNADGGWGFRPGKQSWLEPTVYAALVLHGEPAADRAWALLKSWQDADGAWRPAEHVQVPGWGTSLCVSLAQVRGESGDAMRKGVEWLLDLSGTETGWLNRLVARLGLVDADRDPNLKAWPWKAGTSSWVEPTAHALVALQKAARVVKSAELRERVEMGQAQILSTRCADGGWNYGAPNALHIDLPSYPETTGLALFGLQGRSDLASGLDHAEKRLRDTTSPLACAWLTIALALHGREVEPPAETEPSPDLAIAALEALAAPDGNYRLLGVRL